jgi:hypothetical protein
MVECEILGGQMRAWMRAAVLACQAAAVLAAVHACLSLLGLRCLQDLTHLACRLSAQETAIWGLLLVLQLAY